MSKTIDIDGIFIDLDGTFLANNKPSSHTKNDLAALHVAQEKGIFVIIGTGRSIKDAVDVYDRVRINDFGNYIIHSKGSVCEDLFNKTQLFKKTIPFEDVTKLIEFAKERRMAIKFDNDDNIFINHIDMSLLSKLLAKIIGGRLAPYELITLDSKRPYLKIGFLAGIKFKYIRKCFAELQALHDDKMDTVLTAHGLMIETTGHNVNKGSAATELAKKLKIDLANCVAFGDSMNDKSIFEVIGHSVAMGNAEGKLKKIAKYTTSGVTKNGISEWLYKYGIVTKKEIKSKLAELKAK